MKILAFNGSPRKGGNTEFLLRTALGPAEEAGMETELIQVGGTGVQHCKACYWCSKNKDRRCSNESDLVNKWLMKMIDADAIILGSPTYFADMSSEMKAFIDRTAFVARMNGNLFSRKVGAAVVAQRRGGAVNVLDSINHMFLMSRMIVPGSTYWNFGVGLNPGEVANDKEALENMRDLGEAIVWLVQSLRKPAAPVEP
jgi:multimeric flavodoxin WrbA